DEREREVSGEACPAPPPGRHQTGDLEQSQRRDHSRNPGIGGEGLPDLRRERECRRLEIRQAGEGAGEGEHHRCGPPRGCRPSSPGGGVVHFFGSVRLRWTELTKASGFMKPLPHFASHCAEGLAARTCSSVLPWATSAFTRSRMPASMSR